MHKNITVKKGVKLAIRHPRSGEAILAKTLAEVLNQQEWLNDEFKLKFCIKFVENLIDGSVEKSIDPNILEKIKNKPFTEGLQILKRIPSEGSKYLLTIVMEELRTNQNFTKEQQFQFYDELLANFFPGHKSSDFISNK